MKPRTLNLVPMSGNAWAVFASDTPDAQGNLFWLQPVVALALVEQRYPDDDPDYDIQPVCLVEGEFRIFDGAMDPIDWTGSVIDAVVDTDAQQKQWNEVAREHLALQRRERKVGK